MRKGGWWLRRGTRLDAMRYWYQYSDFAIFPALQYFTSISDLLCKTATLDMMAVSTRMRRYNEQTLIDSSTFWIHTTLTLLEKAATAS